MKKTVTMALLLVCVLISVSFTPTFAANTQAAYSKISDELLNAFQLSSERLDVAIWLKDESTEEYQSIISNISEPDFSSSTATPDEYSLQGLSNSELSKEERLMQIEQMQNFIMQKRQIAQAVYLEYNNEVASEFEDEIDGGEIVYISRYSPLIICNINQTEAVNIASNGIVDSLSYLGESNQMYMSISRQTTNVHTIENYGMDAEGVNVGILDVALPDLTSDLFDGVNVNEQITCYDPGVDYSQISTEDVQLMKMHAAEVGYVMINPSSGIAQNCEHVYFTASLNEINSIASIEWMLDQGVNIISNSTGIDISSPEFDYDSIYFAKWLDHIAYNHSVHYVIASGNSADQYLNAYSMAYNVVTVGGTDDKNTVTKSDDSIWYEGSFWVNGYLIKQGSSYNSFVNSEYAYKPDLCAPGASIMISGTTYNGTSLSTPHVAGIMAILCSYKPELLTKQALLKSILLNSVSNQTTHRYDTTNVLSADSGYRKYGAGIVNAFNAKLLIDSGNYINTNMSANKTSATYSIGTIQAGQTVSITLVFLKRVRIRSGSHENNPTLTESDLPRMNLHIRSATAPANAMHILSNEYNDNNVQRLIFTATTTDEYAIVINKVGGDSTYETLYAVSWMVDTNNMQ